MDSVKVVVDDDGMPVSRMEYLPYGETWFQEGDENNAPKYNSQELDRETNFYFYNARYYDPEISRFVTPDTVIPRQEDTQSWNRHSYCSDNPIAYKDPTGHTDQTVQDSGPTTPSTMYGAQQHANRTGPTSPGNNAAFAAQAASKLVDDNIQSAVNDKKRYATVQYATDVVIDTIESMMAKRLEEYEKTGDKKLLNITAEDIVKEVGKVKIPETMLVPEGGHGAGYFKYGKTMKENFEDKSVGQSLNHPEIEFSEKHVRKLAESFLKGKEAMEEYYEETSGYYGQGFNDDLKLFRMDSMSAIREKQMKKLTEQREKYEAAILNK